MFFIYKILGLPISQDYSVNQIRYCVSNTLTVIKFDGDKDIMLLQTQISKHTPEEGGTGSFLTSTLLTLFQGFEIKLLLALTCPPLEFRNHIGLDISW